MLLKKLPVVLVLTLCAAVWAAPDSQPATEPASQPAPLHATDKDALAKAVGTTVTITGTVNRTNWLPNGSLLFINFEGTQRGDFTAIVRKANRDALDKAFDGSIADALDKKKVSITGKIVKYKETLQMEITKASQITIVKE